MCACSGFWRTKTAFLGGRRTKDDERGFIVEVRHQTFAVSINLHIIRWASSISRRARGSGIFALRSYFHHPVEGLSTSAARVSSQTSSYCWRHFPSELLSKLLSAALLHPSTLWRVAKGGEGRKEEEKFLVFLRGCVWSPLVPFLSFTQQHFNMLLLLW